MSFFSLSYTASTPEASACVRSLILIPLHERAEENVVFSSVAYTFVQYSLHNNGNYLRHLYSHLRLFILQSAGNHHRTETHAATFSATYNFHCVSLVLVQEPVINSILMKWSANKNLGKAGTPAIHLLSMSVICHLLPTSDIEHTSRCDFKQSGCFFYFSPRLFSFHP